MTDTAPVESPIYTHPTLRTTTHETLRDRIEQIRARRLVAAMEFKSAEANRLKKEHGKLTEKWEALAAKLSKKEYSLQEEVEKFEADLNKLIQIHNQMSVLEV
jgi:valyl-tRNA synthetase